MKVGDILICKKELEVNNEIIIGNKYYIYDIDDNKNIDINIDNTYTRKFYSSGIYNINEYFYTPVELRQLKLESL